MCGPVGPFADHFFKKGRHSWELHGSEAKAPERPCGVETAPHKKTPKTCKRSPERVSPKKGVPAKGVPNELKSFPLESKGYPYQSSSGLETGMNMACPRNGRRSPVGCPEKNNAFCHACVGTIAKKARGGSGRFKRCLQTQSEFAISFRQTTNFRGL